MTGLGTYSEDNCADVVIERRSADSLLVGGRSTSLVGQDEAGTNPDGRSAEHQSRSNRLAVEQTTSGNDLDGLTRHRALPALDQLGDSGDEDRRGDIARVATTLTTLGADDIGAGVKGLLDVLGVANHVHVQDAMLVQLLDDGLGRDTDGADEESGTALDDDVDEFVKLALGVVVAGLLAYMYLNLHINGNSLGLSSASTDLRNQQINTERGVLVVQEALQFCDLFLQHLGGVTDTTDDTQTTGI